jgi:hypothetical protein
MDSVKNSQTYQNLANGPMASKASDEAAATKNEFSNLAAARQTPSTTAANGQNLTHYHSLFYNLLSWENPRATGISYAAIVIFIFATRYVPLVRYGLKLSYMILGVMAAAELAGKMIFSEGFATKMRPRKYYTVPRETLESVMEDLVELANFFVIEFQRVVFAENVYVTIGVCLHIHLHTPFFANDIRRPSPPHSSPTSSSRSHPPGASLFSSPLSPTSCPSPTSRTRSLSTTTSTTPK